MTTMIPSAAPTTAAPAHWHETHVLALPERAARTVPLHTLPSSAAVQRYLRVTHPDGIYTHQADAATCAAQFEDFAVTTGTASGKTLCFHLAALEALGALPETKVIVLYPQKALGAEQEGRWRDMLQAAGLDARVGRIDGSVPVSQRVQILDTCRVVILTPDVMHAWLLGNLSLKAVRSFIRATRLVIIDEVFADFRLNLIGESVKFTLGAGQPPSFLTSAYINEEQQNRLLQPLVDDDLGLDTCAVHLGDANLTAIK